MWEEFGEETSLCFDRELTVGICDSWRSRESWTLFGFLILTQKPTEFTSNLIFELHPNFPISCSVTDHS